MQSGQEEKGAKGRKGGKGGKGGKGSSKPQASSSKIPEQSTSTGATTSTKDSPVRTRGGYKSQELVTVPASKTASQLRGVIGKEDRPVTLLSNFIRIKPMKARDIYQYRVDYEPNIESVIIRKKLFAAGTESIFKKSCIYDGMSDARSSIQTPKNEIKITVAHPTDPKSSYTITIKRVGLVSWGTYEMLRIYNMHIKTFFKNLGFYLVSRRGDWVSPNLSIEIGRNRSLMSVGGYRTAVNIHDQDGILMNCESVRKLLQKRNVREIIEEILRRTRNNMNAIEEALVGKLVVTNYNSVVYKIEQINHKMNPLSTFFDKKNNRDTTYEDYFSQRYGVRIVDLRQPLLLVVQNNRRRGAREGEEIPTDIYLVPELCNIAGLTNDQRQDNTLKIDLIRSTQLDPKERIKQLNDFLASLQSNREVQASLEKWGYSYEPTPAAIQGRQLPSVRVGVGDLCKLPEKNWQQVDEKGSFERHVIGAQKLASTPKITRMAILISRSLQSQQGSILRDLSTGFKRVGLEVAKEIVMVKEVEADRPNEYIKGLRSLGKDITLALVILPNQNKANYDAVKKLASGEMGLITQVVTGRLMTSNPSKASGAAVKIGIQVAAKLGGEPWRLQIPLSSAMVCGYDTYHDSTQGGRSYGAFVASMNDKLSSWFSKADRHEHLEELSANMATNFDLALKRYKTLNRKLPEKVFIYRDGVDDGKLEHVYNIELKQIKSVLEKASPGITLTFIIVTKRIGARFYLKTRDSYINPLPGTVVDTTVTRKGRFDFYLISASTHAGTISPTYYNVIYDESPLNANDHQALAFKLCFLYYNWTGAVRVPAPVQYAHKLALLCGEHLHQVPNAILDDRLHFL